MDKIAICAIFKDEARYLLEWLAFHRLIGVDSFVLYDNGSTDGGADLVRRSHFARHVTLIDWPGFGMQIPAYQDFCDYHAAKFDWAAIIDLDEFIMPVGGDTIREPLRLFINPASVVRLWSIGTSAPAERAGDRELHQTPDRQLPNQPSRQASSGAWQGGIDGKLDASYHQCQRTHLQHARPDRSILCGAADRMS
jgi:hypothetical protein